MILPRELVYYSLWIAHPILQITLSILMIRRGLNRLWPCFFSYTVAQVFFFGFEFAAHRYGTPDFFFYASYLSMIFGVGFGFRAIHEIFRDVFRPFHALRDLGTVLFRWVGLLMLLVAVIVGASANGGGLDWLVNSILSLQRSLRVMQCGMVLFLLVFLKHLGLNWRSRSFGIAWGFGMMAGAETVVSLMVIRGGSNISYDMLSMINMITYNLAILTWFGYMLAPVEVATSDRSQLKPVRWNQGLTDLQQPALESSLIPQFEDIVDRAFSTTILAERVPPLRAAQAAAREHQPSDPIVRH